MNWTEDGKIVRVALGLEPSTVYTVTIVEGGWNISGLPLASFEFSFTAGEPPPSVGE